MQAKESPENKKEGNSQRQVLRQGMRNSREFAMQWKGRDTRSSARQEEN